MLVPLSSLEEDDRCRIIQILDQEVENQLSHYYWNSRTIWLVKKYSGVNSMIHLLDSGMDVCVNLEQAKVILVQVM